MKKTQIYQFDPVIYPIKLWITCTNKYEPINDRFCDACNNKDLNKTAIDNNRAVTFYVKERIKGGYFGLLVVFTGKEYFTVKDMAHEASHVVDFLWEHISEGNPGDEAKAYFTGWVVDCMNQVKTNKFK